MQHAPYIDVVIDLDVEEEMRKTAQRPAAQSRQIKQGSVSGRAAGRVAAEMSKGGFECVDEAQCQFDTTFVEVMAQRIVDIVLRSSTQRDRRQLHYFDCLRTFVRKRSK